MVQLHKGQHRLLWDPIFLGSPCAKPFLSPWPSCSPEPPQQPAAEEAVQVTPCLAVHVLHEAPASFRFALCHNLLLILANIHKIMYLVCRCTILVLLLFIGGSARKHEMNCTFIGHMHFVTLAWEQK